MPLVLRHRAPQLAERMDDPHCDRETLYRTYAQFSAVNRLVAGWHAIYRSWLRPRMQPRRRYTLLDIGAGGGDVVKILLALARHDGVCLEATALDPDPRAAAYFAAHPCEGVAFIQATSRQLANEGARFDFVISNHLLHHLSDDRLQGLLCDSERLAKQLSLHNDIERGDLAYVAFACLKPFFRGSFIVPDGLTSIRRSYTRRELAAVVPPSWRVERRFPYRLLLVCSQEGADDG
jgi:2-polyprenyl-3-methyl-5-hydroxy-6-metoxy-1,4-benzoquinol methylase